MCKCCPQGFNRLIECPPNAGLCGITSTFIQCASKLFSVISEAVSLVQELYKHERQQRLNILSVGFVNGF